MNATKEVRNECAPYGLWLGTNVTAWGAHLLRSLVAG